MLIDNLSFPSHTISKPNYIRILFLVVLFMAFLYKFSFALGGEGISANYTFLLFPLGYILLYGKVRIPNDYFWGIMLIYLLVLIISTLYQFWYLDQLPRRIISFVIFMTMFSFLFIKIDQEMELSFKLAVIVISVLLSLNTLKFYMDVGGAALGFAAKDAVGGQRFGFVYVFALWITLFQNWKGVWNLLKYVCIFIILLGILLTFSRSGIVATLVSMMLFGIVTFYKLVKRGVVSGIIRWIFAALGCILVLVILSFIFPQIFEFFDERLFSFFAEGGVEKMDLENSEGSEGYRIYMLKMILEFVSRNPLTGAGYLGVWIMFEDQSGSAHNQYTDILFRTGILGMATYIYILVKLSVFLYKKDLGLFWGFVGMLIYGMFHETFKESHGGFIFAFLIGMLGQNKILNPIFDENTSKINRI
ncbi:O-antigen ligase family protein [Daejeonella sp. H1SJ63]|uniref:O-antigen ligase family protein n=1 Tax=Daejeonella sp. H1SJ63 TaxID=3034145 RepID=UPI0023EAE762|nr:O-antigen ligase family protein [Daejeonella sp. H1SJ63]